MLGIRPFRSLRQIYPFVVYLKLDLAHFVFFKGPKNINSSPTFKSCLLFWGLRLNFNTIMARITSIIFVSFIPVIDVMVPEICCFCKKEVGSVIKFKAQWEHWDLSRKKKRLYDRNATSIGLNVICTSFFTGSSWQTFYSHKSIHIECTLRCILWLRFKELKE